MKGKTHIVFHGFEPLSIQKSASLRKTSSSTGFVACSYFRCQTEVSDTLLMSISLVVDIKFIEGQSCWGGGRSCSTNSSWWWFQTGWQCGQIGLRPPLSRRDDNEHEQCHKNIWKHQKTPAAHYWWFRNPVKLTSCGWCLSRYLQGLRYSRGSRTWNPINDLESAMGRFVSTFCAKDSDQVFLTSEPETAAP